MIQFFIVLNLLYALLVYRSGHKNAGGISIVLVLFSAVFYFFCSFFTEFSYYLKHLYGYDFYYSVMGFIGVLTSTNSTYAAVCGLVMFSLAVDYICTLQLTITMFFNKEFISDYQVGFAVARKAEVSRVYSVKAPSYVFAHLRI